MVEHDLELLRILLLKLHQRAVVSERFHQPLVAIRAPEDSVTPPLVRGLMGGHHTVVKDLDRGVGIAAPLPALLRGEENVTRKKDQPGPALAVSAGHLCERKRRIG